MKKQRPSLFVPILWSGISVLWIVLFCLDLASHTASEGLIVMRAIAMLASIATAIISWLHYKAN